MKPEELNKPWVVATIVWGVTVMLFFVVRGCEVPVRVWLKDAPAHQCPSCGVEFND